MGDVVDLDACRRQREEEERAQARAEEEERIAQEQADIDYMQDVISRIISSLPGVTTGSMMPYTDYYSSQNPSPGYRYDDYPSDSFTFNTYCQEAGYNDDGYYEKSWEWDPRQADAAPVDWIVTDKNAEESDDEEDI